MFQLFIVEPAGIESFGYKLFWHFSFFYKDDRGFYIQLIPEFSGAATDLLIVKWIENIELVYKLREIKRIQLWLWVRA